MPNEFINFIHNHNYSQNGNDLDLVHTTDMNAGINIFRKGALHTSLCPIFNSHLLYLFYGRPSYRVNTIKNNEYSANMAIFPICFVFDTDKLNSIMPEKTFPFDSGGFFNGKFATGTHFDVQLENFELGANFEGAKDILTFFYDNKEDYYWNRLKAMDNNENWPTEVKYYYDLNSNSGTTHYDERSSSLEFIFSKPLSLQILKMIVIPLQYIDLVNPILHKHGIKCKIEHYNLSGRSNPNDYMGVIKEKVYNLMF